ncbi:MAG: T9SS type A sorting domain-containing protein, partial [Saprospiraceae bacterium]|nr:T9SS type A sorting domain-containing protein [Saprospiraceae bacterium]
NAVPAAGTAVATDNCSATVVYNGQTVSSVTCTDTYILTRKWTATDPSGNTRTATQKITVRDIQAPIFTASPAHITVQCSNIPAPGSPTASDNCDASVAISYNGETRTNGACSDSYVLTRKWTAADNCGNTRSVTQRITVQDTQKPVFTATPQNLTLQCSDDLPAIATPTASDNCDASVAVVFLGETTANAACAGNYQVLRIWTATDNCGNSTAFTQTISIQDNQAPVFTNVPQHVTIECSDLAPAIGQASASDACGGYVQVLFQGQTMTPGSCPANRTILRTWLAQDECGNTATATQTINIQDTQAPSFSNAPANLSIACGAALPSLPAVLAIDNCDTYVPVTYLGETSTGPNCPYTVTRTWTVADDCGNASTHTQIISVGAQNAGSGAEPEARTEEELQVSIGQSEVRLFPNPASDEVWISLNSETDTEAQLLFFDLGGRLVLQQQVPVEQGENRFRVPLADVPAGLYLVQVQPTGGKSSTHRLVVGKD